MPSQWQPPLSRRAAEFFQSHPEYTSIKNLTARKRPGSGFLVLTRILRRRARGKKERGGLPLPGCQNARARWGRRGWQTAALWLRVVRRADGVGGGAKTPRQASKTANSFLRVLHALFRVSTRSCMKAHGPLRSRPRASVEAMYGRHARDNGVSEKKKKETRRQIPDSTIHRAGLMIIDSVPRC